MWSRNCVNLYYSLSFLPLLIFPCTIKSRSSLLAPSHPGGPGKRAVKRLWCGCGIFLLVFSFVSRFISVYFKVCVFVYPVGHVHWVMQYWWTGKTPNAISCWVTSTVVQVFSSYLCSGMQYLPVLLYRYAVLTCAVVQVCNEMSGQEADQVERRRNSGVERENHVVTCQHRGDSS